MPEDGRTMSRLMVSNMQPTVATRKNSQFANTMIPLTRAELSQPALPGPATTNGMGQRANYVEISDGQWRLHCSHWGAAEIGRDIFWGPDRVRRMIRACEPAESWLDEVSCEGAVLLDRDRRCLLFFAGGALGDNLPLRRVYLQMLALVWPGWQLRWADDGLADIVRYVGDDTSKVIVRDIDFENAPKLGRIRNLRRLTSRERGIWFTVRDASGDLADNYFVDAMQSLLLAGPPLVDRFPNRLIDPIPPEDYVRGGAWIDVECKELTFWRADSVPDLERRFGAHWPGWSVRRQTAGWQTQLELSGRSAPELQVDPAKLVRAVTDLVLCESPFYSKNVLQQMMNLQDEQTRLDPRFLDQHPGVILSRQQKVRLLGEVMAQLNIPGTEELEDLLAGEQILPVGQAFATVANTAAGTELRAA
jgi:hypothetical protein